MPNGEPADLTRDGLCKPCAAAVWEALPDSYHQIDFLYWGIRDWAAGIHSRPGTRLCHCGHDFDQHAETAGYAGSWCAERNCNCEHWDAARMLCA